MNPFDFDGPSFLLFYLVLAGGVIAAQAWAQWLAEPSGPPRGRLTDPYRIAYLRGGGVEVLRIAALSLLDRGLLSSDGLKLMATPRALEAVSHPLERTVLSHFATAREARSLKERAVEGEGERGSLEDMGLVPDRAAKDRRDRIAVLAAVSLTAVASTKIVVALARGHTNIVLLVVLYIMSLVVLARIRATGLTIRGRAALADLQALFGGVGARVMSVTRGGQSREAVYLAAVFGTSALAPVPAYTHFARVFGEAGPEAPGSSHDPTASSFWGGGGGCGSGGGCGGCGS